MIAPLLREPTRFFQPSMAADFKTLLDETGKNFEKARRFDSLIEFFSVKYV